MAHEILHLDKTTRGSRDARTPHARRDYRLASREICFSIYTLSDLGNSSNRIGKLSRTMSFYKITEIVRVI